MFVIRILVGIYFIAIAYNNLIREVKHSEIFRRYKYIKEYIAALDKEIEK